MSPLISTGGDGSADSNGITPPAVVLQAPKIASFEIVTLVVLVNTCESEYVAAAAVCEYVPTDRVQSAVVSSAVSVVSAADGATAFCVTAIHDAGFCPGKMMYEHVAFGVVPAAPEALPPEYH